MKTIPFPVVAATVLGAVCMIFSPMIWFPNQSYTAPISTLTPTITPTRIVPTPTLERMGDKMERISQKYPQMAFLNSAPEPVLQALVMGISLFFLYLIAKVASWFIPPLGMALEALEMTLSFVIRKLIWVIGKILIGLGHGVSLLVSIFHK